jgi:hypothetical protein
MLKKYLWQFLGAVLALAAIFATYDVYIRSQPVTKLQVTLKSVVSLGGEQVQISGINQPASNMELVLNHKVITNAVIYQVEVKNTGNQPITESDYSQPLSFRFDPKDEILEAVTASDPANIGMNIQMRSKYQAVADAVLLNPQDTVSIRFTVAVADNAALVDHFQVGGRIVGVKAIEVITSPKTVRTNLDLKNVTAFSVMGVLAGIFSSLVYERLLGSLKKSIHVGGKGV